MTRRNRGVFWVICGVIGTFAVAFWAHERQKAAADKALTDDIQKRADRLIETSTEFLETEAKDEPGEEPPPLRIAK